MGNRLRIKPLLRYEVHYRSPVAELIVDTFTADEINHDIGLTYFSRTGNVIRVYQVPLEKILITPVDSDEEIPT
jgi:hypothetical protein